MPAALLLVWHPEALGPAAGAQFDRVAAEFPARVRAMASHDRESASFRMRTWTHADAIGGAPAVDHSTGSWLTVLGNPTARHLRGAAPADVPARLLRRHLDGGNLAEGLSPPFALVVADGRSGALDVVADPAGLQHLYVREQPDGIVWIVSSLLALAAALGGTPDPDAMAEWLAAGHFVSERTVLAEVRKLGAGERLRLGSGGARARKALGYAFPSMAAVDADYRRAFLDALADSDAGDRTAAELTGGLDSRLVLAGRIADGLGTRSWTIGNPESAELRAVRRLQCRAGFEHIAVPVGPDAGTELPSLIAEMHALADGEVNALEYAPLLLAFAALDGRRSVSVSGSGGEIARAYYYRALRRDFASRRNGAHSLARVDARALTRKVSSATRPIVAALAAGAVPQPLDPLGQAIEGILDGSAAPSPEGRLDDFYVRARMQRFAGRNVTTTGLFCRQGLPFFDRDVVAASYALPPARKRDGRVVRSAVAAWAPGLARVPLDSGIAVAARGWRRPGTQLRWGVATGRRGVARFGGTPGRRIAATGPGPLPWEAFRAAPAFREYVQDVLGRPGLRVHSILDPAATTGLLQHALSGGSLYPLGLVLTLELTLARCAAPSR